MCFIKATCGWSIYSFICNSFISSQYLNQSPLLVLVFNGMSNEEKIVASATCVAGIELATLC